MITRLQFGTNRLESFDNRTLQVFLDKSWMHFGDAKQEKSFVRTFSISYITEIFRKFTVPFILKQITLRLLGCRKKLSETEINRLYDSTNFETFYYQKGDILPFEDNSLNFIFSAHFFEHLFLDETISLLKECHRVLKPFGVIRTIVPDADLRTYERPEPAGFPKTKMSYAHPSKHKTRWSVYSLSEALRLAGFNPVPLHYCDKEGNEICTDPKDNKKVYDECLDQEMVFSLTYITRMDSLIIDGIKKPL